MANPHTETNEGNAQHAEREVQKRRDQHQRSAAKAEGALALEIDMENATATSGKPDDKKKDK
jgi:hypothetical protein